MKKPPKSTSLDRWGILNPWGDVWTVDTFNTPEAARQYVEDFWRGQQQELSKFRVAKVRVRVSVPLELRAPPTSPKTPEGNGQ